MDTCDNNKYFSWVNREKSGTYHWSYLQQKCLIFPHIKVFLQKTNIPFLPALTRAKYEQSAYVGHCIYKDHLPLFHKRKVVILVMGFLFSSHRYGHPTPWGFGLGDPGSPTRIGPSYDGPKVQSFLFSAPIFSQTNGAEKRTNGAEKRTNGAEKKNGAEKRTNGAEKRTKGAEERKCTLGPPYHQLKCTTLRQCGKKSWPDVKLPPQKNTQLNVGCAGHLHTLDGRGHRREEPWVVVGGGGWGCLGKDRDLIS